MLYSKLFGQTVKESRKYESKSHELLTKAGFIDQVSSGIYNFLPLGKRVLTKIENIIRQEMEAIGAEELAMPLLHPKQLWETTSRWDTVDVLFKTKSIHGQQYALAPTHEEIVTPLAKKYIRSYRDLPLFLYHITEKFRDEPRPKSGILRGREFGMKDLYSFHQTHDDLLLFYKKVTQAYLSIFKRCGLSKIKITEASGGSFTKKYSHEFNILTPAGEVNLVYCSNCDFAQNEEILPLRHDRNQLVNCPNCHKNSLQKAKAIEVGNIFDLGTKFSTAFDLKFIDRKGNQSLVVMGCYGIGTTRLLGTIVEVNGDEKGIVWPKEVSPYQAHLINLVKDSKKYADLIYRTLVSHNFAVIYDERDHISGGEKLTTADLVGIPVRLIISDKTGEKIEWKERSNDKKLLLTHQEVIEKLHDFYAI